MTWEEALEHVVRTTGHERFRALTADECPDHVYWRSEMLRRVEFPGIGQQLANAAGAVSRVVGAVMTGQAVMVDDATKQSRMATCQACSELIDGKCRLCGCGYMGKLSLETEKCPLGKW
jgi:hypothetical protein